MIGTRPSRWGPDVSSLSQGLVDFDGDGAAAVYVAEPGILARPSITPAWPARNRLAAPNAARARGEEHGHRVPARGGQGHQGRPHPAAARGRPGHRPRRRRPHRRADPAQPSRHPHGPQRRHPTPQASRRRGRGTDARMHPHMLRHTFVTTMLDAGVSLRDVQIAARHADPRTTMRYDRARRNLDGHPTASSPPSWPPEPEPTLGSARSCRRQCISSCVRRPVGLQIAWCTRSSPNSRSSVRRRLPERLGRHWISRAGPSVRRIAAVSAPGLDVRPPRRCRTGTTAGSRTARCSALPAGRGAH